MHTQGKLYLGQYFNVQQGKNTGEALLYTPADLTTHAVVVGMTGSGKTGLCINLMEEAALNNLPALIIDPKGDLTNTLLHFPDLAPQDFMPWINSDQAQRAGISLEQAAADTASQWRQGLADWEISPQRIQALKNSAHFAVYTPGSDAGIAISILDSFKKPDLPWSENRELLREKISGTVTALLGLVGLTDMDPVRSREHILLANIFENAWSQSRDLDLSELILQTQTPPFQKLGVFDINVFFPEKDRLGLAMLLNNILASPAFQSWMVGQALDIPSLLIAPDGRPRHSVFYLAHLSEAERMFFVTLLFSAIETWMRSQAGSSALRSLIYFDEIAGYLPPVGNPPSKLLILRMLKQARAFGVGLVLATQNPVDLDYKALSNAGTWFIGKLQTDQDKQRLLDGLQSSLTGGQDRAEYDRLISSLGKRIFLLHNVHNPHPLLFQTRWTMNFLAGPLARGQIRALNQLANPSSVPEPATLNRTQPFTELSSSLAQPTSWAADRNSTVQQPLAPTMPQVLPAQPSVLSVDSPSTNLSFPGSATRPTIPTTVAEYFLPNNLTFSQAIKVNSSSYPPNAFSIGILYRPVLLAQASVRFLNRKYDLDFAMPRAVIVTNPDRRGMIRWDNFAAAAISSGNLDQQPIPQARFASLEAPLSEARTMQNLQKDFLEWAYRASLVVVRANEALKIYAGPQVSPADFRKQCADVARKSRDTESVRIQSDYEKKMAALRLKISRAERNLSENETELSQRRMEEMGTHAENLLGIFGRNRRRLSTSLTKRRLTEQTKSEVEQYLAEIQELKRQIPELEQAQTQTLSQLNERWSTIANDFSEITLAPFKKDVLLDLFGVAWLPYHLLRVNALTHNEQILELPAWGQ